MEALKKSKVPLRGLGYTYTLLRGMRKVAEEFSLIYLVCNMRSVSILSVKGLMFTLAGIMQEALKTWNLNPDWIKNAGFCLFSLCECEAMRWLIMADKQSLGAYLPWSRRLQPAAYKAL